MNPLNNCFPWVWWLNLIDPRFHTHYSVYFKRYERNKKLLAIYIRDREEPS
jgi:hypothetical protein